ncbi:hypothetical protein EAI_03846 [Harpegnathos saltator]|uniref:THAP9-like helix-turn-helix domain-containing protein n=1 Tax=Harpegnathos saltator TaxID=610380 RepID=E2BZ24_HARSA|nr:hypothetical protein EAI_03846 [Harpegnathos saltator]
MFRTKNLLEREGSDIITKNFSGHIGEIFQNEWKNANRNKKGYRYSDEIKKFAVTLHFYSPKAYNYCREILKCRLGVVQDSSTDGDTINEKEDSNKSSTSTTSYGKKKYETEERKYETNRGSTCRGNGTTKEITPLEIEEGRNIAMGQAKPEVQTYEEYNGFKRVCGPLHFPTWHIS